MAIQMSEGFKLRANNALDDRIVYATISEMVAMEAFALYEGIIAFCEEDGQTYQWKSSNEEDASLKKWRKFSMDTADIQKDATLDLKDGKLGVSYGAGLTTDESGKLAVDTAAVQVKLTAGNGINITEENVEVENKVVGVNTVVSVNDTVFATKEYVDKMDAVDNTTIVRAEVPVDSPEGTVGAFQVATDAIVTADKGIEVVGNKLGVKAGVAVKVDADGVSVDLDEVQAKLTAGTGIKIVNEFALDGSGQPTEKVLHVAKVDTDVIATKEFVNGAITDAVAGVNQFDYQKVESLADIAVLDEGGNITGLKPDAEGNPIAKEFIIYLVPQAIEDQKAPDIYDEYIVKDGALELIGNTDVPLDNYYNKGEVDALIETAASGGVIATALTPNQTVGGASSATPFEQGTTIETILRTILVKEIAPTMSVSANTKAFNEGLEYGTTVAAQKGTASITYNSASEIVKIDVYQDGALIETVNATTGKETSLEFNIPEVTSNTTFKVVLTYKQSDGSTTKTLTVDNKKFGFVYMSYYGALAAVPTTENEITALSSKLLTSVNTINEYTTSNQMMVFATPYTVSAYEGSNSTIVDTATGYKLNWSHKTIDVTVTAADGSTKSVAYNVYYSGIGAVTGYKVKFS